MRRQCIRLTCRRTDECTSRRHRHFGHVFHDLPPLTRLLASLPSAVITHIAIEGSPDAM
jgi:peptide methionine sulfoxide reductase MsrB